MSSRRITVLFFVKQKTAYEMRISDWSSDVCSSDLSLWGRGYMENIMTLRAAVQMDPMDGINIAGDSSFALMLTAQERGYTVYHYDVRGLTWEAGRLTTPAPPVLAVRREAGAHSRFGEAVTLDLGRDADAVLMGTGTPIDLH